MTSPPRVLRTAEIVGRRPRRFHFAPNAAERAEIAAELGLLAIEALAFEAEVCPAGHDDMALVGKLQARVVQPCIVTLAPVVTTISETVTRRYLARLPDPPAGETEMPEDDGIDPLPERLDLGEVMIEALLLALPDYPRAGNEALGEMTATPPGVAPLEAEARPAPFAALAALRMPSGDADAAPDTPTASPNDAGTPEAGDQAAINGAGKTAPRR